MSGISNDSITGHFRKDFMWGTATASYQIEGAWNKDGKGVSVWDTHAHTEGLIDDGSNGDIACDSYHKYLTDISIMKKMKVSHYRFSLSWSRLLPTGDASKPNPAGVDYYNKLIDALLANGIKPCVTLYHWDLPQSLQDNGGFLDDRIIQKFEDYAGFCFSEFGDRVKMWITINEPHVNAAFGFAAGTHAPGIKDPMSGFYKVSRTMLLSHAKSWRLYDTKFRSKQDGIISITLNSDWCIPQNPNNPGDLKGAEMYQESTLGWFAHPVFINGDFPEVMKELVAKKSDEYGFAESRLPALSEDEKSLIKGTHDFFGLNHYTTRQATPLTPETEQYRLHPDLDYFIHPSPEWDRAGSSWLYIVPWGLRKLLNYVSKTYGNPPIVITENGCSTKHPPHADNSETLQLNDEQRCGYIKSYINEALKAHLLDGVDLRGYFVWSLMDNFEWATGYTERFGLHHVDFSSPDRARTARKSATVFADIIANNGFNSS